MKERDDGFTLLELVTAVGMVLIFVFVGLLTYQGVNGSSKQAAVNRAADLVYDKAYASLLDNSSETTPKSVESEYNLSQGGNKDIIVVVQDSVAKDKARIKVRAIMDDFEAVRITPGSGDGSNPIEEGNNGNGENVIIGDDTLTNFGYMCNETQAGYLPIVNIGPETNVYMWETKNKNKTFHEVDYLAPNQTQIKEQETFIRSDARLAMLRTQILENNGYDYEDLLQQMPWSKNDQTPEQIAQYDLRKMVHNVSDQVVMKANVEYSIMYDGDVETFTNPGQKQYTSEPENVTAYGIADCLRSVDNLGNSTNLKNMVYVASDNLTKIHNELPSSVVNLHGLFENAINFNDPRIEEWDTSNVRLMTSVFYNTRGFDRDISNWDTSNVLNMRMMFVAATSFNQNLNNWDTSNVRNMQSIFQGAEMFNNGCDIGKFEKNGDSCDMKWRTDNLVIANSMFSGRGQENVAPYNYNSNFNQNISATTDEVTGEKYWDMSNVENVNTMFSGKEDFHNVAFNNGAPVGMEATPMNWEFKKENVSFVNTFRYNETFNQDTKNWKINSVSSKSGFSSSSLECKNVHPLLYTKNECV